MLPDRMRGWLTRQPAGAINVLLVADLAGGLQEIGSWERKEVEELHGQSDGDVANFIIHAAQEFADGEDTAKRVKFLIQWKGTRKAPLRVTTHWAIPTPPKEDEGIAPGISDSTIIRDLLKALTEKDKTLVNALKVTTEAYEKTIGMLTGRLDAVYKEEDGASSPLALELTEQQQAENAQRSEAMRIFIDKVPELFDLGIALIAQKHLKTPGEAETDVVDAAGKSVGGH